MRYCPTYPKASIRPEIRSLQKFTHPNPSKRLQSKRRVHCAGLDWSEQSQQYWGSLRGLRAFFRDHFQELTTISEEQVLRTDLGQIQCNVLRVYAKDNEQENRWKVWDVFEWDNSENLKHKGHSDIGAIFAVDLILSSKVKATNQFEYREDVCESRHWEN